MADQTLPHMNEDALTDIVRTFKEEVRNQIDNTIVETWIYKKCIMLLQQVIG